MTDRGFVVRWGGTAMALFSFPYVVLAALTPAGRTYTGVLFNPSDGFFYLAQVLHGRLGDWTFRNYFTYLEQPPLLRDWMYPLLGRLTRAAGPVPEALAFQGSRLVLTALLAWQAWRLCVELLNDRPSRRTAFLFMFFTAGLGVYQLLIPVMHGSVPLDLAVAESSLPFEALYAPHLVGVLLLLAIFLRHLHRALMSGRWTPVLVMATTGMVLTTIHPEKALVLLLAVVLVGAWGLGTHQVTSRTLLRIAIAMIALFPYPAYILWLSRTDAQFINFLHQDRYDPVSPAGYLLAFGIPLVCALAGVHRLLRPRHISSGEVLLWSFTAAGLLLVLFPSSMVPRKSIEGVQMAISILAGRNLVHELLPRLWRTRVFAVVVAHRPFAYNRRRLRLLSLNLVVILSSPTVLALAFASPRAALGDAAELYLGPDDPAALAWLRDHAMSSDVVIGGPVTGQFVAAYGGTHVVFGHWQWTPNVAIEAAAVHAYFSTSRGSDDQ
ncbi:MAG: hypothetical protein ACYDGR_16885, partial [Candidatus Dormibacteria bacterium]